MERAARIAGEAGNLTAVTDEAALGQADVIVVNVGLDVEEKGDRPAFKIAPFRAALEAVARHMRPGALILLETTVPPGTCERIVAPALRAGLEARGLPSNNLLLAYSYERVMPGEGYLDSITDMWRVYAGLSPEAADLAERFLSSFIDVQRKPLTRLANIRSVELAKVLENTYRAVNIALIDEWERFARRVSIDLFEVLEAIRIRPTHNNIRYPGLGVGGYCLTKDPMFGAASAREIFGFDDLKFPLSLASVTINDAMPLVSVDAIERRLDGGIRGRRVLILGASYREDVGDMRTSPSTILATALLDRGAIVEFADPLVESIDRIDVPCHRELPGAAEYDVIILAVAHREFRSLDVLSWLAGARPLVFDSNGVLGPEKLAKLKASGVPVAAIGRGDIA
jgi:nucleotide sugar dehydrogenase